jgi:hypothetical protein
MMKGKDRLRPVDENLCHDERRKPGAIAAFFEVFYKLTLRRRFDLAIIRPAAKVRQSISAFQLCFYRAELLTS